jgi:hypothetical protein
MMKACIEICEAPFVVEYDYTVHSRGYPASRDEPASAMEYEVKVTALYADEPNKPSLEIPAWLGALIQKNLEESDSVYDEIAEDEHYAGADDEYERRRDDQL